MFVGSDAIHSLFPVILQIRMLCGQPEPRLSLRKTGTSINNLNVQHSYWVRQHSKCNLSSSAASLAPNELKCPHLFIL